MRINYFGILLCAMALSASLVMISPVAQDMLELLSQQDQRSNCDPVTCTNVLPDHGELEHFIAENMVADTVVSAAVLPCRKAQTL